MITSERDLIDYFWARVAKSSNCWIWRGSFFSNGYGSIPTKKLKGKASLAHRISWELANGPIQNGKLVLHKCDNPACVRPSHLFIGTHSDNYADAKSKNRIRYGTSPGVKSGNSKFTMRDIEKIRRLAADGKLTAVEIANSFGVNPRTISRIAVGKSYRNEGGAIAPFGPPRGEKSGKAKLTEKDVVYLRKAVAAGDSYTRLAEELNVSPDAVRGAVIGARWKHIPGWKSLAAQVRHIDLTEYPCRNCANPTQIGKRRGRRCHACDAYFWRTGKERPVAPTTPP